MSRQRPNPAVDKALRRSRFARSGRHRGHRADRAEEPRLRGDRRAYRCENGLYAAAAGAIIYALFCTSRQISTGPSSSLAAVAGGAVLATGSRRPGRAQLVAAITLAHGRPVPAARAASAGLDRAVPVEGGHHRVPGRRRDRRGDRRAAEAHRHVVERRQRVAGARRRGSRALGDMQLDDARRRARLARRDPRRCASPRPRSRARSCWWSAGCSPRASSTSARTASRSSATCRAACPARRCPTRARPHALSRRSRIAAVALLLIGFSQTAGDAQGVRGAAPLPHRRQPGVGRAGHGQRRAPACSRACRSRRASRRAR